MPAFDKILLCGQAVLAAAILSACGDYGAAAGPADNAKARFEYRKAGVSDKQRIDDSIGCGMDYFVGTLTFQFDKAEDIDRCMRSLGYEPDFPSPGNERRVWTLEPAKV